MFALNRSIKRTRRNRMIEVAVLLGFLCLPLAHAQTLRWDGGGADSNVSTPENWDPDAIPGSTDDLVIDSTADAIVWDAAATATVNSLLIDTGFTGSVTLAFTGTLATTATLTVNAGTLRTNKDTTSNITAGTAFTVGANGTMVVRRSSTSGNGAGQTITAADLTVASGGLLHADGEGFGQSQGPGRATSGNAATHGGRGGSGAYNTYGSISNPTSLGSGAAYSTEGGGAIVLRVTNTATIDGMLSASAPEQSRGGAGGSLNIAAGALAGSGTIQANGGRATNSVHGGGGGRISLDGVTTDNFIGTIRANGGSTGYAGTIYLNAAKRAALSIGGPGDLASLRLGSDDATDYTFGSITIYNGGTLEIDGNPSRGSGGSSAVLNVTGNVDIQSGGTLSADRLGYPHERGPGGESSSRGASHGGRGGSNSKVTYGSFTNPTALGSAGGYYSDGGGAVILNCDGTVTVNGMISATAPSQSRGAAGGSVNITANVLNGTGTIRANGGSGGGFDGGGGGRIGLDGVASDNFTGSLQAYGGSSGYGGTIYLNATRRANLSLGGAGDLTSLRLGSDDSNDYTFGSITILSGGTLEMDSNPSLNGGHGGAAALNVTNNLDVRGGGLISAERLGFAPTRGPGGMDGRYSASHGGRGGSNSRATYGSLTNSGSLGSGAGYSSSGGGAVIISAGDTVNVDGIVSADATNQRRGAAGGTVSISADSLTGSGTIRVNGGFSTDGYPGGGGGRIAVKLATGTTFGSVTFQAFGGTSSSNAAAGTIYREGSDDGAGDGELLVDDNHVAPASGVTTEISTAVSDRVVGDVRIINAANLGISNAAVTLTVSGSWRNDASQTITDGTIAFDGTASDLVIDAGGQAFDTVTFNDGGTGAVWTVQQAGGEQLVINDDFTITSGTVSLNGFGLTVSAANTTFSNDGTLRLMGTESIANLINDVDSGTWEYVGNGDGSGDNIALRDETVAAADFFNLTINDSTGMDAFQPVGFDLIANGLLRIDGGTYFGNGQGTTSAGVTVSDGTFTGDTGTVDVNGSVTLAASGAFNASSGTTFVNGSWTNSGGAFDHNGGTVNLDGTGPATITHDNTWNNLVCTVPSRTLNFEAGRTQTIEGLFQLNGGAAGTRIQLRSTAGPAQWSVDPQGTRDVRFVAVEHANNLTLPVINPYNSVESVAGSTIQWFDLAANPAANPTGLVLGNPTTLSSNPSGGQGPYVFSWTGPNGFTSTLQNPGSLVPPLLGNNIYSLTVTDANLNSMTAQVVVITDRNAVFANPLATPTGVVLGDATNLSSTPQGGSGAYTFSWVGPGGFTSSEQNPGLVVPPGVGPNVYTLTTADLNNPGLLETASVTVNVAATGVSPNPIATAPVIVQGESSELTASPSGGSGTYVGFEWTDAGGKVISTTQVGGTVTPAGTGVHTYMLTVTDSYGITGTASVTVFVVGSSLLPNVDASPNVLTMEESTFLTSNPTGGTGVYVSFTWTDQKGTVISTEQNPGQFRPDGLGLHTLTLTIVDASGLVASESVQLAVAEPVHAEGLFVADGWVRYKAMSRSSSGLPRDYLKMTIGGLTLYEGTSIALVLNGLAIGSLPQGDGIRLERRGKRNLAGSGQLGSGSRFFSSVRVRWQEKRRRMRLVARRGAFGASGAGGAAVVQSTAGWSPSVELRILLDDDGNGFPNRIAVIPTQFLVKFKASADGSTTEAGRNRRAR